MNKTTIAFAGVLVVAVLLTWISVAYAETYDVEIFLSKQRNNEH